MAENRRKYEDLLSRNKILCITEILVVIANPSDDGCGNLCLNRALRLLHEYIRNDTIQFCKGNK